MTKQMMNESKTSVNKKQQLKHWLISLKTREHTRKRNKQQLLDRVSLYEFWGRPELRS